MKWLTFVTHPSAGPWFPDNTHPSPGDIADKWLSSATKTSDKVINSSVVVNGISCLLCSSEIRNLLLVDYNSKYMHLGCVLEAWSNKHCWTTQLLLCPAAFGGGWLEPPSKEGGGQQQHRGWADAVDSSPALGTQWDCMAARVSSALPVPQLQ